MDINNIEKLYVSATSLEKKAEKIYRSMCDECGGVEYDEIEDEFTRELCGKILVMVAGIEEFREFVINNDL